MNTYVSRARIFTQEHASFLIATSTAQLV